MAPILMLSSLLDSIRLESLVGWLLRMTLICALGLAYLALARRAHPATRHAVAVASLFAVALLPLASVLLPAWSLPVLPGGAVGSFLSPTPTSSPGPTSDAPQGFSFAIDTQETDASTSAATPAQVSPEPVAGGRASLSWLVREVVGAMSWMRAILFLWYAVAVGLLVRIAIGFYATRCFAERSELVRDENLILERERARRVLGLRRSIELAVSPEIDIPVVVGALRPRVILPTAAATWSRERLAAVLVHEMAHVRRRDGLWTLAARVVTAVFWFHPLVWMLSRDARREAERACDEVVMASGVREADYAEHLVAIARTAAARNPFAGSALALAARSTLERRVVFILSGRTRHEAGSRRALVAAALGVLVMLVGVAVVQPTPVVSAEVAAIDAAEPISAAPAIDVAAASTESPVKVILAGPAQKRTVKSTYYVAGNEDDDERNGQEWYGRASDFYNNEHYARAAEAYENAARHGYRRDTAYYNAGCSYALAGQEGKAIDALREAFEEGFTDADMYARDDDLNSLRDDPRFKELFDEVMTTPEAEAERRAANREYERMQKRSGVDEGEWNSIGIDLMRSGDYEHAADAFDREYQIGKDEDALYNKACARSLAGKKDEALKLLDQAIRTGSVGAEHMNQDSDLIALHDEKRFDDLVELAEDLELNTGFNSNAWKGNETRRWQKSLPRFEQVTRDHPDIGRAWFNLGFAQLAADQPDQSTVSFKKALDLNYRPETTMYNLACSAAQSGHTDVALDWLERSEKAGMEMWSQVRWDDDLDPLRSDARFKKMMKKWRTEARDKDKHKGDFDDAGLDG